MSKELKIGSIITGAQKKDAVHMALAPVVAGHGLAPGQHVGLGEDGTAIDDAEPIGVVDPFLKKDVEKGQKFWLFMYPGTITSLRHEWAHPAFVEAEPDPDKTYSEKWLRLYAMRANPYDNSEQEAYERLVGWFKSGEIYYHGLDLHSLCELHDADELFHHAEVVFGKKFDRHTFAYTYSC